MTRPRPTINSLQHQIRTLTRKLNSSTRQLESVTAERLANAEELKAVIEQIEACHEQITSANREMLQLRNEVINADARLQNVIAELTELLNCIDVPIVLVGKDLRIRRFTKGASKRLKLSKSHVGRPVEEGISIPNVNRLVAEAIDSRESHEGNIMALDGRVYSLRIQPYQRKNTAQGAVLTLIEERHLPT
jgi:two-component system CheB/CheR fusion protein